MQATEFRLMKVNKEVQEQQLEIQEEEDEIQKLRRDHNKLRKDVEKLYENFDTLLKLVKKSNDTFQKILTPSQDDP